MQNTKRPRRLRSSEGLRKLVRETTLLKEDLIYPLFVVEGQDVKAEISSMPGVYHLSIDRFLEELKEVNDLGILGVLIFGVPDEKDALGSAAYDDNGIVQKALRAGKAAFPDLLFITDICLCGYTDHGHCGIVEDGKILNDPSVELLVKIALSHAQAGADIVAPSDMMDGRIGAIRKGLDAKGFEEIAIMSYSVKYGSAFYGPFREAAHSAPAYGDRKTYQMDYSNAKEALREVALDIEEGADIVMVKPALAYLDIIKTITDHVQMPVAAYNVSGEYAMIKAAAEKGWINEKAVVLETLTAIKRAGAKIIITYFAKDLANWLVE